MEKAQKNLYFHYDLQAWIKNGIIQDCGHPNCSDKRIDRDGVCNQHKFRGFTIDSIIVKRFLKKEI